MEFTMKEFRDEKGGRYLRGAIDRKIAEIIETYPDISVAQHMLTIFRSKGELSGNPNKATTIIVDPFTWPNDKTLKRLEEYQRELEESYLGDGEFSEDFEYNTRYGR